MLCVTDQNNGNAYFYKSNGAQIMKGEPTYQYICATQFEIRTCTTRNRYRIVQRGAFSIFRFHFFVPTFCTSLRLSERVGKFGTKLQTIIWTRCMFSRHPPGERASKQPSKQGQSERANEQARQHASDRASERASKRPSRRASE